VEEIKIVSEPLGDRKNRIKEIMIFKGLILGAKF
jgi:hypothetical protein